MLLIRLYSYVDETGQDTYGKFFLVSVLLVEQEPKEALEPLLEEVETRTKKGKTKWKSTPFAIKKTYLEEIVHVKALQHTLFYSVYEETKAYTPLTALSIAKAIHTKVNVETDYFVTIVIDGLTKKDTAKMRIELKKLKIKYKTIRGMKDEQSVFLRLADSIAGFVQDYIEDEPYAIELFKKLKKQLMIQEA